MSVRHITFFLSLFQIWLLVSCQLSTPELTAPDYDYFPLETGRYCIYDVQKEQFTPTSLPTRQNYQLKEVIGLPYIDVTGQTAYRLMRYRRTDERQAWQADSVWAVRLVNNEAIRSENGLDFVMLLFPVGNQLRWNGNGRNSREPDDYMARNAGQPYNVLAKQFDRTVTVVAQNDSTLIAQDKRLDVFARQVGLIYRERTHLQFCTASSACIGKNQIEYGTRYIYCIRTYGKE